MRNPIKRILICGQRDFNHQNLMEEVFDSFPKNAIIIEGEAPGADKMAANIAKRRKMTVLKFPANWKKYGKAAGPMRNKQMLDEGNPDIVHAFYIRETMNDSKGTKHMVELAKDRGIRVYIHISGKRNSKKAV